MSLAAQATAARKSLDDMHESLVEVATCVDTLAEGGDQADEINLNDNMKTMCAGLSHVESAKLQISLAYSLATLFYSASNVVGKPAIGTHKVQQVI